MRLLDRLLKPTIDRLMAERIKEERRDALYRYRVHSDPARLRIHPTAVVNNAIFNTGGGHTSRPGSTTRPDDPLCGHPPARLMRGRDPGPVPALAARLYGR